MYNKSRAYVQYSLVPSERVNTFQKKKKNKKRDNWKGSPELETL